MGVSEDISERSPPKSCDSLLHFILKSRKIAPYLVAGRVVWTTWAALFQLMNAIWPFDERRKRFAAARVMCQHQGLPHWPHWFPPQNKDVVLIQHPHTSKWSKWSKNECHTESIPWYLKYQVKLMKVTQSACASMFWDGLGPALPAPCCLWLPAGICGGTVPGQTGYGNLGH